jgi:hypothetical protein
MDEKVSKDIEILGKKMKEIKRKLKKRRKKMEMLETKTLISKIIITMENTTNRLNHTVKKYQKFKTKSRKFYIEKAIQTEKKSVNTTFKSYGGVG